MPCLRVLTVDIGEHAILLDHEHVGAQAQQRVEFSRAKRVEVAPQQPLGHAGTNSSAAPVAMKPGTSTAKPRRCSNSICPKVR